MVTIYCRHNELHKWDENVLVMKEQVEIGNPLTIEFRRISITSKNFDLLGKSEVMIVNHVKTLSTKDKTVESITYYDDDAKTKGKFMGKKKWSLNHFDPSEYGNPVCFHTPGYIGNVITITTKMWDIDKCNSMKSFLGTAAGLLKLAGTVSPYIEIASSALGYSNRILNSVIKHDELCDEHVIELRLDSSQPLVPGKFICLPDADINERDVVLKEYFLEQNQLVRKVDEKFEEYPHTYFILKLSDKPKEDLIDFDFMASSADLLKDVQGDQEKLLDVNRDSHDLKIIEEIKKFSGLLEETGKLDYRKYITALTKQLSGERKSLL